MSAAGTRQEPHIFQLHALGISHSAMQRLRPSGTAEIIFIFRNGFSIVPKNEPDGCPIFVSSLGTGLLPEHVVIPRQQLSELMARAQAGDAVAITAARSFSLVIKPTPLEKNSLAKGLETLESGIEAAWTTGLGLPCSKILSPQWEWAEIFHMDWSPENSQRHRQLKRLIGRGQGSTPAGDDMLVGALAFLSGWHNAPLEKSLVSGLWPLQPELASLTTRTSELYLHHGLNGVFSSDLIRLTSAVMSGDLLKTRRSLARLLKHGATSGLDSIIGFVLAARSALG